MSIERETLEYAKPSLERTARRRLVLEIILWLFVWVPLVAGLVFGVVWVLSQGSSDEDGGGMRRAFLFVAFFVGPPGLVAFGTLLGLVFYTLRRAVRMNRRRRAMVVVGYLENAMRLNFPLDRYLLAAEESEEGGARRRLADLRVVLSGGAAVGEALARAVPEVPVEIATAVKAAEGIGQLQPTLTRLLVREERDHAMAQSGTTPFYRFYLPLMVICVGGLAIFLDVFIVPKYRDIFRDFHTIIPEPTSWLMNMSDGFVNNEWFLPTVSLGVGVLVIVAVARAMQRVGQRLRGAKRTEEFFPGLSVRRLSWHVPVWRRLVRDRAMAGVLEFLADGLRAGLPLVDGVQASLQLALPQPLRRRVERWLSGMVAGGTPSEAARAADMPELVAGFLQSVPRVGGGGAIGQVAAPEMFDFLASYYRERFARLAIFLRGAAEPLAVLLMGFFVGGLVYALFVPLVALINAAIDSSERGFL